jgi:putative tryptophan/tyrosine transport system substrate-binding protein
VITRRRIAVAGGIGLIAPSALAWGQSFTKTRRVGILLVGSITATAEFIEAFKLGMRDLGWVEEQNVEYRIASADGNTERLDALASDLVAQQVEVILMGNPLAAQAAQQATKTIPIVMANVPNPVENRFVASLAARQAG